GELGRSHRRRCDGHRYDRLIRWIEPLKHRLLHFDGQVRTDAGNRVANVLSCDLWILLEQEQRDDLSIAVTSGAEHFVDAGDSLDRILDRLQYLALDPFRRRAGIRNEREHDWLLDVGELVDLQPPQREQSEN